MAAGESNCAEAIRVAEIEASESSESLVGQHVARASAHKPNQAGKNREKLAHPKVVTREVGKRLPAIQHQDYANCRDCRDDAAAPIEHAS